MDRRRFTLGGAAALTAAGAAPTFAAAPRLEEPNAPPGISGLRIVGYMDIPGGGQVIWDRGRVFIGHVNGPLSTSIIDARDPKNMKLISQIGGLPPGAHAHKVRVRGDIMFTNLETAIYTGAFSPDFLGGIKVYDISNPARPREIHFWKASGAGVVGCGVHRFTIDDRYVYASPTQEGYDGNICMILDFQDPTRPEEVGRWHSPGQWIAGGEHIDWPTLEHRCHHPMRMGDRLYVSYWHAGAYVLDISDMSKPKMLGHFDPGPTFEAPTHTFMPLREGAHGRRYAIVTEEDAVRLKPGAPPFVWMLDITDDAHPTPVDTWQVPGIDPGYPVQDHTGTHQPAETYLGHEVPFAYFAQGCRVLDISDPRAVKEVAYYVPEPPQGFPRVLTNDVTVAPDGLIYMIDRNRGLTVLERI